MTNSVVASITIAHVIILIISIAIIIIIASMISLCFVINVIVFNNALVYECDMHFNMIQWGQATQIYISKLTIIGSENGLSPGWLNPNHNDDLLYIIA